MHSYDEQSLKLQMQHKEIESLSNELRDYVKARADEEQRADKWKERCRKLICGDVHTDAVDEADSLREQRNMLINFLQHEDCWVQDVEQAWRYFCDQNPEASKWVEEE